MFQSGKIYTHSQGLSCSFRQWRSKDSHCRYNHGYSLQFELVFERKDGGLDDRKWVMGFGDLKPIKKWLVTAFDHKTILAHDDPGLSKFQEMDKEGYLQLRIATNVGVESFAYETYMFVKKWLASKKMEVNIKKVIVREHEGNWASYEE